MYRKVSLSRKLPKKNRFKSFASLFLSNICEIFKVKFPFSFFVSRLSPNSRETTKMKTKLKSKSVPFFLQRRQSSKSLMDLISTFLFSSSSLSLSISMYEIFIDETFWINPSEKKISQFVNPKRSQVKQS